MPDTTGERRRVRAWGWTAAVLAVVAAVCLVLALHGPDTQSSRVSAAPDTPASAASLVAGSGRPVPPKVVPATAPPAHLRIPAIDVSTKVTRLGLNADRTVEVPSDPATTGWYRLGPAPGDEGSAVILGHVDSNQGPAVFYRLRFLRPGDRVLVRSTDGSVHGFRVTAIRTYPNAQFPAEQVYGPHGHTRGLQLVTCGGAFDSQTGYQSNVVVYTTLISRDRLVR